MKAYIILSYTTLHLLATGSKARWICSYFLNYTTKVFFKKKTKIEMGIRR